MTVLLTAWAGAGRPFVLVPSKSGRCARCSRLGPLVPTRDVVSKVFTAYDGWAEPAGQGLCPACSWGYSAPALRLTAHLVTAAQAALRACDRGEVCDLLRAGPLEAGLAVIVPLRPGRKHLLPEARWGQVTVDDARLPWSAQDALRLAAVVSLRAAGFGSRMLTAPSPAYTVLRRLPRTQWPTVISDWRSLDPWRTPASPWMALALHLTLTATPKEKTP